MRLGRCYLRDNQKLDVSAPADRLDACRPERASGLLVQVFSSFADHERLLPAVREIQRRHPEAVVIGASTDGEIEGRHMRQGGALFLFAWFEQSRLRSGYVQAPDSTEVGRRLAEALLSPRARVAIAFINGLNEDGDAFLRGFDSANPKRLPLTGAVSADGTRIQKCRILAGDHWLDAGAVGVALEGDALQIGQESLLGWHPVGQPMRVERAQGTRVMRIDGRSPLELYRHYLGEGIAARLPQSTLSFPLFIEQQGIIVARTAVSAPDKTGAIHFAGEIPQGAKVRFGIVNSELIDKELEALAGRFRASPPEALFAYSCMARKGYFGNALESGFAALESIAPVGGFFSYGELHATRDTRALLNGTTTLLALGEKTLPPAPAREFTFQTPRMSTVVEGLSHLIERALEDLDVHQREILLLREHDSLTGLPNRYLLARQLEDALLRGANNNTRTLVVFIGIDRFKDINDAHGHSAGDALLRQFADRLASLARDRDLVARFGGDVFVLAAQNLHPAWGERAAETIARRLIEGLEAPFDFNGFGLGVRVHIGLVLSDGADLSAEKLFKQAELALFASKSDPHHRFRFYDDSQQAKLIARLSSENRLRAALAEHRLRLALQPQVDLEGRLIGAEALLRIQGDDPAWQRSAAFIPVAEQAGLITEFGAFALDESARILAEWQGDPSRRGLKLSVNISAEHFTHPDFSDEVMLALERHGAQGRGLVIELTESVFATNTTHIRNTMEHLKQQGVSFSLDDFGTGYSSLAYLRDFPLSELKIDQSFIRRFQEDTGDDRSIHLIQAIIEIGEALRLDVVAEGVETEAQWQSLKALDCPYFQGWLFGKAVLYPEQWPPPELQR